MNKKNESGNIIRTFAAFCGVICAIVGLLLVRQTINISNYNKQLIKLQNDHIVYVQVARYFRTGVDELTQTCRHFVATGDYKQMESFFKELEEGKHRERAIEMLNELDLSLVADNKLEKAKIMSDDLLKVEYHAMALAALAYGYYDRDLPEELLMYEFEPYEVKLTSVDKKKVATDLVFNNEYSRDLQKIHEETDSFLDEEIKDKNNKYNEIYSYLTMSIKYQRILTYAFVVLLLTTIILIMRLNKLYVEKGRELMDLNEKLTAQKDELEEISREAQKANNAKSLFLAKMSNAIRNPINSIINVSERARMNTGDQKKISEYLGQIDSKAQILLELVNEVLTLGRGESGMVNIQRAPFNINNFIENCVGMISGMVSEGGLIFIKDTGLILHPNIIGDELHFRQIILNIVDNAVKFTPEGGRVTFRIYEEINTDSDDNTARYHIEIEDTGVGMSEQYISHVFESFSQENDEEMSPNGLGLGMSITKRYVELMGGNIGVESELKRGTRFTVVIPFEIYRGVEQEAEVSEDRRLAGTHILIAEDNELNMEIARTMLLSEGAEVTPAENGLVTLSLFKSSAENEFDAILMDVAMPMMDGITVTKEIRALNRQDAKTVPIIAMVAGNDVKDINVLIDAGMNDYISKPVDVTRLVKTLLDVIRKQSNDLARQLDKALRDANTDALTGVKNRNAFELSKGRLDAEIESGEDMHFSIVVFDVNGLKYVNDNVGHDEGNRLLINSCRLICRTFSHSPVFRIGGDEFVAILRNEDYKRRKEYVGQLRERMTSENYEPGNINNVSFAIGIADYDPAVDRDCNDVFKRADAVMYEHKKSIKGEGNIR